MTSQEIEYTYFDDNAFRIFETRHKVFISEYLVDDVWTPLITGGTMGATERATRWHLKCLIDGFPEPLSVHDGFVGGKL